jgi:hypothetical protein
VFLVLSLSWYFPGTFRVGTTLFIRASGVVLRGAGAGREGGTVLLATARHQHSVIQVEGAANYERLPGKFAYVSDSYVPVGARWVVVSQLAQGRG